jgi:hypothetical protein
MCNFLKTLLDATRQRFEVCLSSTRQSSGHAGHARFLDYVRACSNNVVITDEIRNLVAGPLFTVTRYQAMDNNGYTFYTMAQDEKSVYQNSGVRVWAIFDDSHDDDDTETDTYYSQIEEI